MPIAAWNLVLIAYTATRCWIRAGMPARCWFRARLEPGARVIPIVARDSACRGRELRLGTARSGVTSSLAGGIARSRLHAETSTPSKYACGVACRMPIAWIRQFCDATRTAPCLSVSRLCDVRLRYFTCLMICSFNFRNSCLGRMSIALSMISCARSHSSRNSAR